MKQTVAMGAVVATLALAGTQALAGDHLRCETEVAELNIAEADVEGIFTVPKFLSRARRSVPPIVNRRFDGVQAWVSMNSCKGSVVIRTDRFCRIRSSYARGECRVAGLKTY